ncbi:MAG: ATP-binding protein [Okeania sp. SIO3I5]|nr:ATP-binding protein [Okeania sp. SIO3I5]NEQ36532.1 ATP-binding protein [Okeania sp. SIO3I5]
MTKVKDSDKLPKFEQADLQVFSDLEENDKVLSWFEQLHQTPIPKKVWLECELALVEGFTNVVRHAHKYLPRETPIDIEVQIYTEQVEITIWDYGQPFELLEWLKQQPTQTDIWAGGGWGIKLMYAIADNISYTRTSDHRNCLLIVKKYWPPTQEENNTSDGNT